MKLGASKNAGGNNRPKEPQNQLRKRLIARKEPFICAHCQTENTVSRGRQLNHCKQCLSSLHVDEKIPGDRLSTCKGVMRPATVSIGKRGSYIIVHECTRCGKIIPNQAAEDDNIDLIISLINANPKLAV